MSSEKRGPTLKEVMAARGRSYADAAEAYAAYSGTALPPAALDEALWYERLRRRMVAARKSHGKSQGDVARAMETSQSEVSRLETSLGPGTRLGTLRGYVAACETTVEALLVSNPAAVPLGVAPGAAPAVVPQGGVSASTTDLAEAIEAARHDIENQLLKLDSQLRDVQAESTAAREQVKTSEG